MLFWNTINILAPLIGNKQYNKILPVSCSSFSDKTEHAFSIRWPDGPLPGDVFCPGFLYCLKLPVFGCLRCTDRSLYDIKLPREQFETALFPGSGISGHLILAPFTGHACNIILQKCHHRYVFPGCFLNVYLTLVRKHFEDLLQMTHENTIIK